MYPEASMPRKALAIGAWVNDPVPLFPYPGSPGFVNLWGLQDSTARERTHDYNLSLFEPFSDIP